MIYRREVEGSPKSTVHLILRINKNAHRYRQQAGDYQVRLKKKPRKLALERQNKIFYTNFMDIRYAQCVAWFGAVALTSLPARLSIAVLGDFPHLPPSFVKSLESEWVYIVYSFFIPYSICCQRIPRLTGQNIRVCYFAGQFSHLDLAGQH